MPPKTGEKAGGKCSVTEDAHLAGDINPAFTLRKLAFFKVICNLANVILSGSKARTDSKAKATTPAISQGYYNSRGLRPPAAAYRVLSRGT